MAKIVYISNGMASTLNSSLELARRLVAEGHQVLYLSHKDLGPTVRSQGHEFHRLVACDDIRREFSLKLQATRNQPFWRRHWDAFCVARHYRQKSLRAKEIPDILRREQPAFLLIDVEMHYAIVATRPLKIPTLLVIVWFSIFRSRGYPPLHTLLVPTRSWWGRFRIHAAWGRLLAGRWIQQALAGWGLVGLRRRLFPVAYDTNQRADLRDLARAHGLNLGDLTQTTHWLKPHTYRELPVLAFNAAELDFPHALDRRVTYVGPMVHQNRLDAKVTPEARGDWRAFLNASRDAQREIVYCSLGTFWTADLGFLRRILTVFDRRQEWALVIGLGSKATRSELGTPPENVLIMDYAPQIEILKESSAAITHGGITTINECLRFAVPMLVCSTSHVDQDGCAARVAYHGVGIMMPTTEDAQAVEASLERTLGDASLRDRVEQMRDVLIRYEENRVAECLIGNWRSSWPSPEATEDASSCR